MIYRVSTIINKPLQEVFQFVTRVENESKWQAATVENIQLTDGPMRVGVMMRHTGQWLGRKYQSDAEVIEYEPNSKWAYKSVAGPFDLEMHFQFEPAGNGTSLTMDVSGNPKGFFGFFKLLEPLVNRFGRRTLEDDLARLKSVLEAGV